MRRILAVGILAVALPLLTGCTVAGSYINKGVEKLSANNVEQVFDSIITDWEALTVTADNACLVGAGKASTGDSPTLVESPVLAYAATYRNVRASYNASQHDIFKAQLLGPPGYPKTIPNWPEAIGATPDFCSVSAQLADLKAIQ